MSARMKAVADMVSEGSRVCDVGCDHGYIPIYLVQQKISPGVLAMDIRTGPLGRAGEHIRRAGLEAYITLRLSDGLCGYQKGEADTLICAGMGGRLIRQILEREPEKSGDFRELILQPQSEAAPLRKFLRAAGYCILWEDMVLEEGKFYPIIKAAPRWSCLSEAPAGEEELSEPGKECQGEVFAGEEGWPESERASRRQELEDMFGPVLLGQKHPVLLAYLEKEAEAGRDLRDKLKEAKESPKARQRLKELEERLSCIRGAARICGGNENVGGAYDNDYDQRCPEGISCGDNL